MPKKLLMGNQAFAWAALQSGVRVVAGYPGTPSSELVETVAALRAQGVAEGVHVEWSTNEKAALEMLVGASLCGERVLFTCKQVGLNVASDPLMSLNYVGIKGGFVLFVADDPGPISSQTEQDTRRFGQFAKVPVLDPSTPEEGFEMMRYAFELSEAHQTPVIVRPTTRINHASTFFDVPDRTQARPAMEGGFERSPRWVIFPKRAYQGHGEVNDRLEKMSKEFASTPFNPVEAHGDNPRLGVVASGVSASYAREALSMIAAWHDDMPAYRFMQVGCAYPLPWDAMQSFAEGLSEIIVFEELDCVVEEAFVQLAGREHLSYDVHGKGDKTTLDRGENSTDDCLERLKAFFAGDVPHPAGITLGQPVSLAGAASAEGSNAVKLDTLPAPVRPPVLCAGCPHRGSFYAVKQALGKRPHVMCGDIGCYTLGNAMPLDAVDTCLCMGAGVTMAQGFSVAEPDRKSVAFIGDSTFFASGITGVVNAVYNEHDVTFVVLDNSTTAMTGSQPHPGTGVTLMGNAHDPIDIEAVLKAVGVTCIERANPFYLDQATQAAARAIDFAGPSAVIYEAPCIQLVKPERTATVDAEACTGCSACVKKIGCPAMSMSPNRGPMIIDPSLCYGCGLCVDVCPFDAIKAPVREEGRVPYVGDGKDGEAHA